MQLSVQRIIFSDNGTLSDKSVNLNNTLDGSSSETLAVVAAQDALYIGGSLPFNHRYFDVSSPNSVVSAVSVELWNGSSFVAAVDVIDETLDSGASLGQSGVISWKLEKNKNWQADDTEDVTGLTSLKIYGMYWAKLTWSANLTATTALRSVAMKFSSDERLQSLHPTLLRTDFITAFRSDKTSWSEQHYLAVDEIVRQLTKDERIRSRNQIVDWELFSEAATHYVAYLIYAAVGDDYVDDAARALERYQRAMEVGIYNLDLNGNTRIDDAEKIKTNQRVIRR